MDSTDAGSRHSYYAVNSRPGPLFALNRIKLDYFGAHTDLISFCLLGIVTIYLVCAYPDASFLKGPASK